MKSDTQLKSDVTCELQWDASINPTAIGVAVDQGIVTLSGQVDNYAQKLAAQHAAGRVGGVRGIALEIEVKIEPRSRRSDADIARAAADALSWHSLVPDDKVRIEVDAGRVKLSGEVDWAYQRLSAEHCIRPLTGVVAIDNAITLKAKADSHLIAEDITQAFRRHADRESRHIHVNVEGGIVTLRGEVDSMAEHDAAIGTAYAARGVTRVIDHVRVIA